jgi:hypothetical protein
MFVLSLAVFGIIVGFLDSVCYFLQRLARTGRSMISLPAGLLVHKWFYWTILQAVFSIF